MFEIRAAIDLIDGKCVRLEKGDFQKQKVYYKDPLDQALFFEDIGIRFLHLVDLDGARLGNYTHYKILEKIALKTDLSIDTGGGIYATESVHKVFDHGAHQITAGSIAIKNPNLVFDWLKSFGTERIILGLDVFHGKISTSAWTEQSELSWESFLTSFIDKGLKWCISTEISKDGMMSGPDFAWYTQLRSYAPELRLIASGGVGSVSDMEKCMALGLKGAIVGKAFYEESIPLQDVKSFILNHPQSNQL